LEAVLEIESMKGAAKMPRHCEAEGRGNPDGVRDDGTAAWIAAARSPSNDEAEESARCSNLAQGIFKTASQASSCVHFCMVFFFKRPLSF
jgi:hypothetical protein